MNKNAHAPDEIVVHAQKYDSSIHRTWKAALLRRAGSLIVLEGAFEHEVNHALLGRIEQGTVSTEYYWTDRWYNIFHFREPSGELRNFYCNISQPATFDGHTLSFIDLDTDVLVAPDLSYKILDRDEFTENARRFNYSPEVLANAEIALNELLTSIEEHAFPFSESVP